MFEMITHPIVSLAAEKVRTGLAVNPGRTSGVPARVKWRGVGRVAPPFFLARLENGPTELAALEGSFYSIIAVRFRHRAWISLAQHMERCRVAVRECLRWNRNLDDYFVN